MEGRFHEYIPTPTPSPSSSSLSSPPINFSSMTISSPGVGSPYPWPTEGQSEERGIHLVRLLHLCADHVAAGSLENANIGLEHISHLASVDGDNLQRIAAYITEALAVRILKVWPGLSNALNATKVSLLSEQLFVQRLFFELCPFLKVAYVITNHAIIEAMEGEKMVHIVDLHSIESSQWINLLQMFSARPEGPPDLRITCVHEQQDVLDQMAVLLTQEAKKLNISFQFNRIAMKLEDLDISRLPTRSGEALAVSSVLKLHSLLATDDEMHRRQSTRNTSNFERVPSFLRRSQNQRTLGEWLEKDVVNMFSLSPDSALSPLSLAASPKMDKFLSSLWDLSPRLVVITEQESDHNGFKLTERVSKALNYYAAIFDGLDSTVARNSIGRHKIEKMLFGEEIKNIIACEGPERKERHEKLEKWILRLELAGFGKVPLSYLGMLQANRVLQDGFDGYNIKEENGRLLICWHNRPLYSISAWRYRTRE